MYHRRARITHRFTLARLDGEPRRKSALLINPPVYDVQYWAQWSQPYGLLRIASLLRQHRYRRIELFDFLQTDERRKVKFHKIQPGQSYVELDRPTDRIRPLIIEKHGERLELTRFHFGKAWEEFDAWLDAKGFTKRWPPSEIMISATMTYWWESTRDLIGRLRRRFGPRCPPIILGGIYPTLAPEHAARYTGADLVVAGEVPEANDLPTDLTLYETPPVYSIITPSRGCPFDCSYCAQKTINGTERRVRFRTPPEVVAEMRDKYTTYGIRDFAFYADFLLWGFRENLVPILQQIVNEKLPFHLFAPEGLDTRFLSQDPRLLPLMKEAGFQKIYLPVENIDDSYLRMLNRKHVRLEHFVQAANMCERAGFRMRNLEVNAFVLYGLPEEQIDHVVKTVLFVSEVVGSIIPMLFAPVPSTALYQKWLPYFHEHGWNRELQRLNGKLYPFLDINEGSISEYVDIQRLMYSLNSHFRSRSFRVFGENRVAQSFRANVANGFGEFVRAHVSRAVPMTRDTLTCSESEIPAAPTTETVGSTMSLNGRDDRDIAL